MPWNFCESGHIPNLLKANALLAGLNCISPRIHPEVVIRIRIRECIGGSVAGEMTYFVGLVYEPRRAPRYR